MSEIMIHELTYRGRELQKMEGRWLDGNLMLDAAMKLAEQPARQQEPVGSVFRYGKDSSGKPWHGIRWTASGLDLPDGTLIYTSPPASKPLADEWVPVTQSLLDAQHPWLYQPMWIALKGGAVVQGYYEWRQGRNPDRFITDLGDEWAFNADFVMPLAKPTPPTIEAHLKEKNI